MIVFRLTKRKYRTDLSGKGAELFGGRWNPVGIPALYTSENRALCILELLAHTPKNIIPPKFELVSIKIPDKYTKYLKDKIKLPPNWDSLEPNESTREIGRLQLEEADSIGFSVPSAIITQERNVILNPLCKFYNQIKIIDSSEINIDERLVN